VLIRDPYRSHELGGQLLLRDGLRSQLEYFLRQELLEYGQSLSFWAIGYQSAYLCDRSIDRVLTSIFPLLVTALRITPL